MAAPTGTFLTTAAIGNREDLTDIIYRISPTATPFLNLASKGKATNTLHEWQVQDLAAAVTNNAQVEGDDASAKTVTPTVRLTNRTQISTKTVIVAGTQQAMNPAGRKDELGYQVSLAALEIKRDIESSATQLDVLATAPRQARGLLGWCYDNNSNGGGAYAAASYTANTGQTNGTQRAFTEAQMKSVLQLIFTAGGEPDSILLPPAAKQTFSSFTGNATRMDKSEDSKLYAAVDFYVSDFGTVNDWSAGITWGPTEKLSLGASYIVNQEAPSISQLGNPLIQSFNVPVYDFSRGETVLVTVIGGGNPLLLREQQRDIKLSANWTLPIKDTNLLVASQRTLWALSGDPAGGGALRNRYAVISGEANRPVASIWSGLVNGVMAVQRLAKLLRSTTPSSILTLIKTKTPLKR